VAASELARDPAIPRERADRYALAESRFRALTDFDGIGLGGTATARGPGIQLPDGGWVLLTDLLVGACQSFRIRLPHRSIDPELVFVAKELLAGLRWGHPDLLAAPVADLLLPPTAIGLSPSSDSV
jgi:hypothetical protein